MHVGLAAKCPYSIGDIVVYKPTPRGYYLDINFAEEGRLKPGMQYKIQEIQDDLYVVVEGYSHPARGLFWTEFEKAALTLQ